MSIDNNKTGITVVEILNPI